MRGLGPVRLAMMGGVLFLMLGFFIFLLTKLGQPNMALLFSELNSTDSNSIAAEVGRLGFPAEVRDQGTSVWVPADKALELRLKMADRGLPVGGKVGFEIFDETDTLGTTDFLQNVNLRRALEGELGRTIQSMDIVHRARVHLVMPRRQLFSREEQQPSASVVLAMRSSKRLDHEQVSAVQNLVASAVPGLKPGRITIIDDKGKLLSPGFEDDQSVNTIAAKNEERRRGVEARMARTIEELLEKTVGFGNVRAEVNADMDFDRVSTTEEIYNPDGQVVRSTQTVERAARNQESETDAVTVGTNLPDAAPGGGEGARAQSDESSTEETVNYEITKKTVNHVKTDGALKRVTVAVLVNGIQGKDKDGNPTYTPRPAEQMELLSTLVRSTIGFDADRGDSVEVVNMEFTSPVKFEEPLELFFGLGKNDLLRLAEILVLSILGILVILLVVRPLVSRAFESIPSAQEAAGRLLADTSSHAAGLLGGPSAPAPAEMEEEQFEELIDIDRVEGRVKASSVKKVGEIVEKHPEEALSIIRAWMYQEA